MPKVRANGIELEYDAFGREDGEPLLLVMGLGSQMIHWDEGFCEGLASRGFHVLRFDNRDVGLSTKLGGEPAPPIPEMMERLGRGEPSGAPYSLSDMAADTAGLLEGLGLGSAHVLGASMGGMIAQLLALEQPERVRSVVSLMSTTGARDLPGPTPEASRVLTTPAPTEREAYVEHMVEVSRTIGSPGFAFDEARARERAGRAYDRGFHPAGVARQLAAILCTPSRREALRKLRRPAAVVHGAADPLIPVAAGRDTANAIPGAEWLEIPGMGHDLPVGVWERLQRAVARTARRAGADVEAEG